MDPVSDVTSLIESLLDAWNRKDKASFCGNFTAEASYVSGEGEWRQGRRSIGELMDQPQVTARVRLDGAVEVRDRGAVLTAIFRWCSLPDVRPTGRGLATCVMVQQEGRWRIDIMQNTDVVRGEEEPAGGNEELTGKAPEGCEGRQGPEER
jgi:uncharacterized protein (TIGR02246 family)